MDNHIRKYLTDDELVKLQTKGSEFLENYKKQQSHKLYKDANFLFQRTQLKQMEKATEKYPEPLNFNSWTADELIDHAFQELVDQSHYLTALLMKVRFIEKERDEYKKMSEFWRDQYHVTNKRLIERG